MWLLLFVEVETKMAFQTHDSSQSGVILQVSVKMDVNEITRTLSPQQIEALFAGIAKVQSVLAVTRNLGVVPKGEADSGLSGGKVGG